MIKTKKVEQEIPQEQFERILTLLISYKQQNPKKDVYLSEKSVKEAINWYSSNFKGILSDVQSNV